ncbi:hypothetical protein SGLAM104S_00738 [Streptomyces glaucescens]
MPAAVPAAVQMLRSSMNRASGTTVTWGCRVRRRSTRLQWVMAAVEKAWARRTRLRYRWRWWCRVRGRAGGLRGRLRVRTSWSSRPGMRMRSAWRSQARVRSGWRDRPLLDGDGGGVGGDAAQLEEGTPRWVRSVPQTSVMTETSKARMPGKATRATRYMPGSKPSIDDFPASWGGLLGGAMLWGMEIAKNAALVVVDVQKGFEEPEFWGPRNNPGADENIASLIDVWQMTGAARRLRPPRLGECALAAAAGSGGQRLEGLRGGAAWEEGGVGAAGGQDGELGVLRHAGSGRLAEGGGDLADRADRHPDQPLCRDDGTDGREPGVRRGGGVRRDAHLRSGRAVRLRKSADELGQASAVSLHGDGFARVVLTKEVMDAAR